MKVRNATLRWIVSGELGDVREYRKYSDVIDAVFWCNEIKPIVVQAATPSNSIT